MNTNLPSKTAIIQYWQEHARDLADITGYVPDWDEPACWTCGYPVETWDNNSLERCHIIPKSLGGANSPSNIVLMCKVCHDTAPDTSDAEAFAQWAKSQSYIRRWLRDFIHALEDLGMPVDDAAQDRYATAMQQPAFELLREHAGYHWFRASRPGPGIKPATIASLLQRYLAPFPDTTGSLD